MSPTRRRTHRPALTVLAVSAAVVCLVIAWWQWSRYESASGSGLNLGYALQWPLFAVAAVWGWTWSQSQYFIKDSGGRVTVYQGVDSKLGPIDLRHQQESTNIPSADLPEFWRSKVTSGIDASSEKEAAATVERLRAEMVACLAASASGNECTK